MHIRGVINPLQLSECIRSRCILICVCLFTDSRPFRFNFIAVALERCFWACWLTEAVLSACPESIRYVDVQITCVVIYDAKSRVNVWMLSGIKIEMCSSVESLLYCLYHSRCVCRDLVGRMNVIQSRVLWNLFYISPNSMFSICGFCFNGLILIIKKINWIPKTLTI